MSVLDSPSLWNAVAFFLVLAVTFPFARRHVLSALGERSRRIKADIDEATRLASVAKRRAREFEDKMAGMAAEARRMEENAEKEAQSRQRRMQAALEEQCARRRKLSEERIGKAEEKAAADVKNAIVHAALDAVRALLAASLKEGDHRRLLERALKGLPRDVSR